jgi:hypothetical protein
MKYKNIKKGMEFTKTKASSDYFTKGENYTVVDKYDFMVGFISDTGNDHSLSMGFLKDNFELFIKTPIYTQAMADNGELPSVGMECMVQVSEGFLFEKCEVIGLYKDEILCIYLYGANSVYGVNLKNKGYVFEPIDTRSNEQKAIDNLLKITGSELTKTAMASYILNNIKSGRIHGVTFNNI